MNQNIKKYLKKNVLLITLIISCGLVLFLCSAGSDSNSSSKNSIVNTLQKNELLPLETDNPPLGEHNNTDLSGQAGTELFYKMMLALVLVIVMGIAAIYLTKKLMPKIAGFTGKEIRIIETVHLGPRKSVHLLEIGHRRLLIGSTYESINKLADLTEFSSDMSILENEN